VKIGDEKNTAIQRVFVPVMPRSCPRGVRGSRFITTRISWVRNVIAESDVDQLSPSIGSRSEFGHGLHSWVGRYELRHRNDVLGCFRDCAIMQQRIGAPF